MEAFINRNGVTKCPGMGTPELADLHKQQHQQWLGSVKESTKKSLGFKIDDEPKDELADLPPELPIARSK